MFRPEAGAGSLIRIAGLSLAGVAGGAAQSTCELQVNVKNAKVIAPNTRVSVKPGKSGISDAAGTFRTAVPPGNYQVNVGDGARPEDAVQVSCDNTETVVVNVNLADRQLFNMTGLVVGVGGPVVISRPMPPIHLFPEEKKNR